MITIPRFALAIITAATAAGAADSNLANHKLATLTLLTDTRALCLDGSPGSYYYQPGTGEGAKKWLIFHEGGGWCSSLEQCAERATTFFGGAFGSSTGKPVSIDLSQQPVPGSGGGPFSSNCTTNPLMCTWTKVQLNYCDGASFSGDNAKVADFNGQKLYFRGAVIGRAILADLLATKDLDGATDVMVSGCSAGGVAAYHHVDQWCDAMSPDTKCAGMSDSGFFLDQQDPLQECLHKPIKHGRNLIQTVPGNYRCAMHWVFDTQNATSGVNQACIKAHSPTQDEWKCFFAEHTVPHIRSPMFALQPQYDSWAAAYVLHGLEEGVHWPPPMPGPGLAAKLQKMGDDVTSRVKTLLLGKNPESGAFLESCLHHCFGFPMDFHPGLPVPYDTIRVNGVTAGVAIQRWYGNISVAGSQKLWEENMPYPCTDCCFGSPHKRKNPIARTVSGYVRGIVNDDGTRIWRGIPYAAPPVKKLRFRPPTAHPSWESTGVREAVKSAACPQMTGGGAYVGSEEHCLEVDVYVPKGVTKAKSVLVWIHGGGHTTGSPQHAFTFGEGDAPDGLYDGRHLAAASVKDSVDDGVVLVHIGYRLGPLGYMAMPELTKESSEGSSGNYGMLDQIAALEWVKENIMQFGTVANPRVVVHGESAGAYSVSALRASPLAVGLFDGIIMESTYSVFAYRSLAQSEPAGTACAAKMCSPTEVALDGGVECLRGLSPSEFLGPCDPLELLPTSDSLGFLGSFTFPNVDGYALKCPVLKALQATVDDECGVLPNVPAMVGSTADEFQLFTPLGYTALLLGASYTTSPDKFDVSAEGLYRLVAKTPAGTSVPKALVSELAQLYPADAYDYEARAKRMSTATHKPITAYELRLSKMLTDTMFLCPGKLTAEALASHGKSTFLYHFSHVSDDPFLGAFGAAHWLDVAYYFNTHDEQRTLFSAAFGLNATAQTIPKDAALTKTTMAMWLNFARNLDPSIPSAKKWLPMTTKDALALESNFMEIGDTVVPQVNQKYPHSEQCAFWERAHATIVNRKPIAKTTPGYARTTPGAKQGGEHNEQDGDHGQLQGGAIAAITVLSFLMVGFAVSTLVLIYLYLKAKKNSPRQAKAYVLPASGS